LKDEISWEQLQKESRYPHLIEERTSVTNKIRRVARFDWDFAKKAVAVNRPTRLAINGLDYLDAANRGAREWNALTSQARTFLSRLREESEVPCDFLGTGPSINQLIALRSQGELCQAALHV
jgi:adenylosuccinate synthase